jgi:hypothetical protein
MTDDPDRFLNRPELAPDRSLLVGVTGHRTLPDDPAFQERIRNALEALRQRRGLPLAVLSSLAEGADRLVAETVLGSLGGSLQVVLPLEPADYREDFTRKESLAEFRGLLDHAQEVISRPGGRSTPSHPLTREEREAAYEWAGREVVDRCEVLVALWDGLASRGRGGTAEIVAYARAAGKPLVWVRTVAPFDIVEERTERLIPLRFRADPPPHS